MMPSVTLKAPPYVPTSSPIRKTVGSRSISSQIPARMASTIVTRPPRGGRSSLRSFLMAVDIRFQTNRSTFDVAGLPKRHTLLPLAWPQLRQKCDTNLLEHEKQGRSCRLFLRTFSSEELCQYVSSCPALPLLSDS